jgi:hypothetical protein
MKNKVKKYQAVVLKIRAFGWETLAKPTDDRDNAQSVAMAPLVNGDDVIAAGVMELATGYVYEVCATGWMHKDIELMKA